MAIEDWSTTAASNNSASPDGAPEGWAPSSVNAWGRETMAQVRTWYERAQWVNWGDTYVYASATSFTITGVDQTTEFHVGRRVRAEGSSTGDIVGVITASTFSTDTTVTVVWDSGSLASETLTISLAALAADNPAYPPVRLHQGADVASATALPVDIPGHFFDVTGTTTVTSMNTKGVGSFISLQFDGILILTHHATDLICLGGANVTTAAGDLAGFYEYAAGDWRMMWYSRAATAP